jgi:hypothetical protein
MADENKEDDAVERQEHGLRKRVEADWFHYDASPEEKDDAIHGAYEEAHPTDASKKAARKKYEDRQREMFLRDMERIW